MQARFKELEFMVEEGRSILQATDTTVTMVQTRIQQYMGSIEAIVGIALAVSQIVDAGAASALLAWWDGSLSEDHNTRLLALGVQLGITVAIIVVAHHCWLLYQVFGQPSKPLALTPHPAAYHCWHRLHLPLTSEWFPSRYFF